MEPAPEPHGAGPASTLFLGVGRLGAEVAADLCGLLPLLGPAWRAAVAPYLLAPDTLALAPDALARDAPHGGPSPAALDGAGRASACAALAAALRDAVASLQTDDFLSRIGADTRSDPPVHMIIAADLAEPAAAAALTALAAALAELLAELPHAEGAMLLGLGVYADSPPGADRDLALDALRRLAECAADQGLAGWPLYLFDRQKEGGRQVASRAELRLMLANQVVPMLARGVGPTLGGRRRLAAAAAEGGRFSVASAVLLTHDNEAMAGAVSAARAAAALGALVDPAPDPRPDPELEHVLGEALGRPADWAARIAAAAGLGAEHRGSWCELYAPEELPQPDRTPAQGWLDLLRLFADDLRGQLPRRRALIAEAAGALGRELAGQLARYAADLPGRTIRRPASLAAEPASLARLRLRYGGGEPPVGAEGASHMPVGELRVAVGRAGDTTGLLRRAAVAALALAPLAYMIARVALGRRPAEAAAILALLAVAGAGLLWRQRLRRRARALFLACARELGRRHTLALADEVATAVESLSAAVRQGLADEEHRLKGLVRRLAEARAGLQRDAERYDPGLFLRPEAAPPGCAAALAAERCPPPADGAARLVGAGLLDGWPGASADELAARALAAGRLHLWGGQSVPLERLAAMGHAEGVVGLLAELGQRARLPLRPSFDRLGGPVASGIANGALVSPPMAAAAAAMARAAPPWQVEAASLERAAVCWRVRHGIPLEAVVAYGRPARPAPSRPCHAPGAPASGND